MGVEWTLACTTCRHHAWLGSIKPAKWEGFQVGHRAIAELFARHAWPCSMGDCRLVVVADCDPTSMPWLDPRAGEPGADPGWSEDLRSRGVWSSFGTPVKSRGEQGSWQTPMVCAECGLHLRSGSDPRARDPLVISPGLWLCGRPCFDLFRARSGRVWEPLPDLPPGTQLEVDCLRCLRSFSLGTLDPVDLDGPREAFAEWLAEHVYRAPEDAGLWAEGCYLEPRLVSPELGIRAAFSPTRE